MDLSDLNKIGLTSGETKVYSALLDLGETTRTRLSKRSGISPSKVYDVANRLLEKGLISSVKKNGVIHFSAADPDKINDFIKLKQSEIEKERKLASELIPILLAKYQRTKEETDVEVFYGWQGMRTVFDDIVKTLEEGDFNYIFGASKGYNSKQADIFFSQYYKKKRKKGFGTKIIFNEDVKDNLERISIFRERPNEIRFLHQGTFTEINLYKDKVLIIMLLQSPFVIRIISKEAAQSFRTYFDSMWKLAAKY